MQEEVAVTAIEYALLGSLIALAIIASIKLLSAKLSLIFTAITTAL